MVLRGDFYIKLENVRVHATEDAGYVTCVEVMNAENSKGRCSTTPCCTFAFIKFWSLSCIPVVLLTYWTCVWVACFAAWGLMLLSIDAGRLLPTYSKSKMENGNWFCIREVLYQLSHRNNGTSVRMCQKPCMSLSQRVLISSAFLRSEDCSRMLKHVPASK